MAETVRRLRIRVSIDSEVAGDDGALLPVSQNYEYNFVNGTGTNQVGWVWQDLDGSLATTTGSIDLDGASNFQGAAMSTNNTVKVMCFKHESDSGSLIIGGGDFSSFLSDPTDELIVRPRGLFLLVNPEGYAITASTGDVLALESTAAVSYKAILAGDNE